LQEKGGRMIASGTAYGRRWAYFDTEPGGLIIEFEERLEGSESVLDSL
jgi:hypothetical protein